LWAKKFSFAPGGADSVYALSETSDGDYLATGTLVDTQQPSAVPGRLPIFQFSPANANSCNNFRDVILTSSSHPVSVSEPELIIKTPKLRIRIPKLEVEALWLETSDCKVVWD
jgi:hypothetical protein